MLLLFLFFAFRYFFCFHGPLVSKRADWSGLRRSPGALRGGQAAPVSLLLRTASRFGVKTAESFSNKGRFLGGWREALGRGRGRGGGGEGRGKSFFKGWGFFF